MIKILYEYDTELLNKEVQTFIEEVGEENILNATHDTIYITRDVVLYIAVLTYDEN
jgi:hypothetical protein